MSTEQTEKPELVPVEEVIEETKVKHKETEAGFQLPGGFDQMLGSVLQNPNAFGSMFNQLINQKAGGGGGGQFSDANNNTERSPEHKPQTPSSAGQPDMSRLMEQSMGMIGSMFQGQGGAGGLGQLFNQLQGHGGSKAPAEKQHSGDDASKMYPNLADLEEDRPKPKPKSPEININLEQMINQGIGSLFGGGKQKKPQQPQQQESHAYPDLDSMEGKPKVESPQSPQGQTIDLGNVINQGLGALQAALKDGQAKNLLNQLMNQQQKSQNNNSSPDSGNPAAGLSSFLSQFIPPEGPKSSPSSSTPDAAPKVSAPKAPSPPKPTVQPAAPSAPLRAKLPETTEDGEKVIDSIPDDAFDEGLVEAFDGLISK